MTRRRAWWRWIASAVILVSSLTSLGSTGASAQASSRHEKIQLSPGSALTFIGIGAGHGVGMDQWGARGRALAGETYQQILSAYYPGTQISNSGNDSEPIRVLLSSGKVLILPMSQYLGSVVASEMPADFPPAAKEAQAVASRTFALHAMDPTRPYDVTGGVESQAFGQAARSDAITAVAATSGQVLTFDGKPILAAYFECAMGRTESNQYVWVGPPLPYLQSIRDVSPQGQPYSLGCPRATWSSGPITEPEISTILATDPRTAVGTVTDLDFTDLSPNGRWQHVVISGTAGVHEVSLAVFRMVVNNGAPSSRTIFSPAFTVAVSDHSVPPLPGLDWQTLPSAPLISLLGE
ncbi:MAG: SpoIID/LytB domain-containing protein [Chloroflexi bacterium]|nr:SpoIID/LytB domain-containing protein [Chloroflexota bacterium]